MKTLIVDDQENNRKVFIDMLKPFTHEIDTAENGPEGIDLFKTAINEDEPYDLILLDIMMPKMDGQTVLKNMRTFEEENGISGASEAKIFIVTALDSGRQAIEAYFRGNCTTFLVKPLTQEVLTSKLQEYHLI